MRRKLERWWQRFDRLSVFVGLMFLAASVWVGGYQGRQDLYNAQVKMCLRILDDRHVKHNESYASWVANTLVSMDKRQPVKTRKARGRQASVNWRAVISYEMRLPREWRRTSVGEIFPEFSCDTAVRRPRVLPFGLG